MKSKYFLLLFFLLSSCRPLLKKNLLKNPVIRHAQLFTIKVQGVECRHCILSVLYLLKSIKPIVQVKSFCPKEKYDQAIFECFIKPSKKDPFQIIDIQKKLAPEEFKLQSMAGVFSGILTIEQDQLKFIPELLGKPLPIIGEHQELEVQVDKKVDLVGTINFDDRQFYIN